LFIHKIYKNAKEEMALYLTVQYILDLSNATNIIIFPDPEKRWQKKAAALTFACVVAYEVYCM
jgi:hypothetical protein